MNEQPPNRRQWLNGMYKAIESLISEIEYREKEIEALKIEASGANERTAMALKAKDSWADRAMAAEARLAELEPTPAERGEGE